jgi:hypothetical protein
MAREMGFTHGASQNRDLIWGKRINGMTFTFKKAREKSLFLYNCRCESRWEGFRSEGSTGFYSERDLTPEEVERLPQFATFISQRRISQH